MIKRKESKLTKQTNINSHNKQQERKKLQNKQKQTKGASVILSTIKKKRGKSNKQNSVTKILT